MIKKNKLPQIFRKAVLSGLAVFCLAGFAGCGDEQPKPEPHPEPVTEPKPADDRDIITLCDSKNHRPDKAIPLTEGEKALVYSIFGDEVKTAFERKYFIGKSASYGDK